jgi:hypothetical protein
MRLGKLVFLAVLLALVASPALAQEPEKPAEKPAEEAPPVPQKPTVEAPPLSVQEVKACDTPNDAGKSLLVTWRVWPGETAETEYLVLIADVKEGPYYEAALVVGETNLNADKPAFFGFAAENKNYHHAVIELQDKWPHTPRGSAYKGEEGKEYFLKVVLTHDGQSVESSVVTASSMPNLFDTSKLNNFILMIIFGVVVMLFIQHAKKNPNLFIRKISGLDAVDEAIGRATEMGKPIFYITGLLPMSELPTIASVNILGRAAKIVAEHDTILKVPCYDPIVMSVAQEVVKDSYTKAGRPDAYREENVFYVTSDQFSYVAAVDGMMFREKPATNFLLGYFYAESLLLAEAGAAIGAIQIAGTDALAQLPFFVTTCDYTLIGEELYAASAYLSREPVLLGSLRGQDIGKAFLMIVLVVGTALTLAGIPFLKHLLTPL